LLSDTHRTRARGKPCGGVEHHAGGLLQVSMEAVDLFLSREFSVDLHRILQQIKTQSNVGFNTYTSVAR
jgi:hypothetical protein